jgi:hypothetical protein
MNPILREIVIKVSTAVVLNAIQSMWASRQKLGPQMQCGWRRFCEQRAKLAVWVRGVGADFMATWFGH